MMLVSLQDDVSSPGSVADRIAEALRRRIVAGNLAPGAPVRQDHVAAEFKASHVPVREAFRKLEAQGLLVSEPRRGVRVAPLDGRSILEVTAMRAALEALALRHAGPHLIDDDFDVARRALAAGEASSDIAVLETANQQFHRAIVAPCRMPRLLSAIDDLHRASARFLFATWKELDWRPRSNDEHRAILARLEAGDIGGGAILLERHILDAGDALARLLGAASQKNA